MSSNKKDFFVRDFSLWGKDHFRILKGLGIAMVLLAYFLEMVFHLSSVRFLTGTASALFLFCSGYGVSESFRNKQGLFHYWENKMLKVWLPSLVVVGASAMLTAEELSFDWLGKNPLALSGWFLYLLFAEYAIFWLVFRFQKGTWQQMLWLAGSAVVLFLMVPHSDIMGQVLAFTLGVAMSQYKLKCPLRDANNVNGILLSEVLLICGGGVWILASVLQSGTLAAALYALAYPAIALSITLGTFYTRKIRIFGLFAPLGTIAYALYLLYEPILGLLEQATSWRIDVLIIVLLLLAASAYTALIRLTVQWNKKMHKHKKSHISSHLH